MDNDEGLPTFLNFISSVILEGKDDIDYMASDCKLFYHYAADEFDGSVYYYDRLVLIQNVGGEK